MPQVLVFLVSIPVLLTALTGVMLRACSDDGSLLRPGLELVPKPKNRFPLVIHHGIMPVNALHKYARDLRGQNCAAYSTQVSPANRIAIRAADLKDQIDKVLKATGAEKVNIVSHSMGGLDSRYLISSLNYAGSVASLSTISSPHRGTPMADLFFENDGPLVAGFFKMVAFAAIPDTTLNKVDWSAAVDDLQSDRMKKFNIANPNAEGVFYQSWSGSAKKQRDTPGLFDRLLHPGYDFIAEREGDNDAVIGVESAKWGEFRGEIDADHFSQIGNHFFEAKGYDPFEFFRQVCDDLAARGF